MCHMHWFSVFDASTRAIADAHKVHEFIETVLGHFEIDTLELSCGAK